MITQKLIALSWKVESFNLRTFRNAPSVVIVCEFPKSGGTWLAKLLASSLDLPFIHGSFFIPSIPCVIRTHWLPRPDYASLVYIVRDCRDVMISLFHHRCRNIQSTPKLNKLYIKRLGAQLSVDKIYAQLSGFIDVEFQNKLYGANYTWDEHVLGYFANISQHGYKGAIKYENLLSDPVQTLSHLLTNSFNIEVPYEKLKLIVALHDKKWGHKKKFITSVDTTFIRQGISGDWGNAYSPEAAKTLADYIGNALVDLGYESDKNWWKEIKNNG